MQSKTARRLIAAIIIALFGGTIAAASPANASVSQGYMYGVDVVTDDWGDEGVLSTTSYANSGATGAWQEVLWAEGLYSGSIDCDFGPATKSATEAFQRRYGLTVDGAAGPQTLGKADNYFTFNGLYVYYKGTYVLQRNNGKYYVPRGALYLASYSTGC